MIDLRLGDCLEVLKTIPDNSVDLVVTDPPYMFGKGGGAGAFGLKNQEFRKQLQPISDGFNFEILDELERVMKQTNIYIWCNKDQIPLYYEYYKGKRSDMLTWHKTNPIPACNGKYLPDTEYCLFFKDKGVPVFGTYETKRKYYVSKTNKEDKKLYRHPTIKPMHIIENLIINSSVAGGGCIRSIYGKWHNRCCL